MYPPLDVVPAWADALRLNDEERAAFILAAYLAHCPQLIADEFLAMRAQLEKNKRIHAENQAKIAQLQAAVDRLSLPRNRVADGPE